MNRSAMPDILRQIITPAVVLVTAVVVYAGTWYCADVRDIYARSRIQQGEIVRLKAGVEKKDSQLRLLSMRLKMLNRKMAELSDLETRIRTVAGVTPEKHTGFSGVGGEMTDAIDPVRTAAIHYDDLARYLDTQIDRLQITSAHKSESLKELLNILQTEKEILSVMPSISPVEGGSISSGFGYRKSPFSGKREFHTGIDIADGIGAGVRATADGVVTFSGRRGTFGNLVVIDHGHGIVSMYGHLSKCIVEQGEKVIKGQAVGAVGSTGRSTGPHIHYEVRFNGIPMDAGKYLPEHFAKR
ncbi:MAG: M23 family metallopeptidase [Deltaproteobacteria bacterium]|nr:M23 family metallopeptidase [Deltaproteobacteria bacterium]